MSESSGAAVRVGHVHLRVSHLERSIEFYRRALGLEVKQLYRNRAAFLSFNDYHHHLAINTWDSLGGKPPPVGYTGLYHVAFLFPDRRSLGVAVKRVIDAGVSLDGSSDHGVSEAVYFRDPDENGIELYYDRPPEEWPRNTEGLVSIFNTPLDIDSLLAEAD